MIQPINFDDNEDDYDYGYNPSSDYQQPNNYEDMSRLMQSLIGLYGQGRQQTTQPVSQMPPQRQRDNYFSQMLNKDKFNTRNLESPISSRSGNLMQEAKSSIQQAYRDNPLMQKVALTQAILESHLTGKPSKLATQNKNLFGIKSRGTSGTAKYSTAEYGKGGRYMEHGAKFGSNRSYLDSVLQHKRLMEKGRYKSVLASRNPEQAFHALQKSGYATDPRYAKKLSNIYRNIVEPMFKT